MTGLRTAVAGFVVALLVLVALLLVVGPAETVAVLAAADRRALVVATAGVSAPVATAAVLLHRAGTLWLPVALDGGAVAVLQPGRRAG